MSDTTDAVFSNIADRLGQPVESVEQAIVVLERHASAFERRSSILSCCRDARSNFADGLEACAVRALNDAMGHIPYNRWHDLQAEVYEEARAEWNEHEDEARKRGT